MYNKKDLFLLAQLLEVYKSFLAVYNPLTNENPIKIYTDSNRNIELDLLNPNILNNEKSSVILYFSEIPFSTITCEFNNNEVAEDL